MKKSKIGLIVEGSSDKMFFDNYFKQNFIKNLKVITSGTKDICKILNVRSIEQHIKALRVKKYSHIIIIIDLDTQCDSITYNCIVKLKSWYQSKIKISLNKDISVVVVSQEIESWMLSAWEKSDTKSKEDLKRKFTTKKSLDKEELFQRFLSSKKEINRSNNKSLDYFCKKIGL